MVAVYCTGTDARLPFEAGDARIELASLGRSELLVSVRDALHHGRVPANGQLLLHDLLQVSLVLALRLRRWFGLLPFVSFEFDRRHV